MPRRISTRNSPPPATAAESRLRTLVERLRAFYGALPSPPASPFAVYVWEVLSLATTPARRDAAFAALRKLPALTADAVGRLPQAKLETAVALAGAMKDERVRALRTGAELCRRHPTLLADLTGPPRQALRAARRLPHLGRASARRVLLFAGNIPVLPLDEHAQRVALRLGYDRRTLLRESGRDVLTLRVVSQYLTHHGLSTCTETSPHCTVCPLAPDCEWIRFQ